MQREKQLETTIETVMTGEVQRSQTWRRRERDGEINNEVGEKKKEGGKRP
jgi:hypothetical protein